MADKKKPLSQTRTPKASTISSSAPPGKEKIRKPRTRKDPEQLKAEKAAKEARKLANIKAGLERGEIKTFQDIFDILNRTPFEKLLGKQANTFKNKLDNPGLFCFDDVTLISNVVKVHFDIIERFIGNLVKNNTTFTSDRHKPLYI
jgi:hypothetical protein